MGELKSFLNSVGGGPVAVLGLGLSGLSVARALKREKADFSAWDDNETQREEAAREGIVLQDLNKADMGRFTCLILAPGIPLHYPEPHPVVRAAREAGIEIIGDIEVLYRTRPECKIIAITGTNGKSTTTALVGHILNRCGVDAAVGGNIGTPVLDLKIPRAGGWLVLEISSYQMDLCPTFRPDIAVILNITPDHIDRHGSFENYIAAKARLFEGTGLGITGMDDADTRALYDRLLTIDERRMIPVSAESETKGGIYVRDGHLFDALDSETHDRGDLTMIRTLPGAHNHQNAAAAYAVARMVKIAPDAIMETLRTYPGLSHRQQFTRTINGVAYINDSKATNAEAAGKALSCYRNIYWILGGKPKDGGLNGLEPFLDRITEAYLIGEAMNDFGSWLDNHGVPHQFCGNLETAVREAHKQAQNERGKPGGAGVVLLSPACASFDQFRNFEQRGDAFMTMVNALSEDKPS